MRKSKKQKELDKELVRECRGYSERDNKPDGAYIKEGEYFFNINKIKRLIEAGADVNAKDVDGESPLALAVRRNYVALAELLISAGADVDSKNIWGESPLHWAVDRKNIALAEYLISAGADVNAKDKDGESPLHLAVSEENVALAELLISAGADVDSKNIWGESPLYLLLRNAETLKIVKLLFKAGATE